MRFDLLKGRYKYQSTIDKSKKQKFCKVPNNRKPLDSLLNQGASLKTAATYSPTVTQYHRRDEA